MNIYKTIKKRYSARSYAAKEIPEQKLNRVLQAARLAPSAHNSQPYKLVVVKNKSKIEKLAGAAGQDFISQAPAVIAAVSLEPQKTMSCKTPTFAVDIAIALDHLTLAAVEEGLGTCWIGAFSQERVKEILEVPSKYRVALMMPLGFPEDAPGPKKRKETEELVSWDKFNES